MAAYFIPDGVPFQVYFPDLTVKDAGLLAATLVQAKLTFAFPLNGDEDADVWRMVNFGRLLSGRTTAEDDLGGTRETIHMYGSRDQLVQQIDANRAR